MRTGDWGEDKRTRWLVPTLFIVAFLLTAASILTGSYLQSENVQVGSISPKRYIATRDWEDVAATNKQKEEAEQSIGPLYKHETQVQQKTIEEINHFFDQLDQMIAAGQEALFEQGGVFEIPVVLTNNQFQGYASLSENGKANFRTDVMDITNSVYEQGITEDSMSKAIELVNDHFSQTQWDLNLTSLGISVVSKSLQPNLVLDEEAMNAAKLQKVQEIQPVIIRKDQKIVDEGEVITQQIYDKLIELNLINKDYSTSIFPLLASIVVTVLVFVFLFFYFLWLYCEPLKNNELLALFTIYILTVVLLRITANMTDFSPIPVVLFSMLVSILLNDRLALAVNPCMAIIGTFIFNGDAAFLIYFILSGSIAALLIQHTKKRKHILAVSFGIGAINAAACFFILMFFENGYSHALWTKALFAMISGIISVMIAMGSLPFWEAAFEINTPFRLLELTNPDSVIMRRLMIEAPGTYHHSLIVANLAETASFDIGANATLARVGAYYHDIGKLKYPLYFSENQGGENPHDYIQPQNSARMIIEHRAYGIELSDQYHLPIVIRDIITQHHGTTLVRYFYHKAKKMHGPDSTETVDESDYQYPGPIPQCREAACVMLADTVEAAVRSNLSNGKNLEEAESLIKTLIKEKLDSGQLYDSGLKIQDLETIRQSFLKVFHGMYHDRIAYPDEKEEKEKEEKEKKEKEEKEKTEKEKEEKEKEEKEKEERKEEKQ